MMQVVALKAGLAPCHHNTTIHPLKNLNWNSELLALHSNNPLEHFTVRSFLYKFPLLFTSLIVTPLKSASPDVASKVVS